VEAEEMNGDAKREVVRILTEEGRPMTTSDIRIRAREDTRTSIPGAINALCGMGIAGKAGRTRSGAWLWTIIRPDCCYRLRNRLQS